MKTGIQRREHILYQPYEGDGSATAAYNGWTQKESSKR